jgi:hypothetical protein
MAERIDAEGVQNAIDAWNALLPLHRARALIARLFIDVDHDALDIASIAEQLLETHITPDALDHIYREEIAPICASLSVIGTWPAFDVDALNSEIARHQQSLAQRLPTFIKDWRRDAQTAHSREHWEQIRAFLGDPSRLKKEISALRAQTIPRV